MDIRESFDHLEAKIGQAVDTINRLGKERERVELENRKLKMLLEQQNGELEAIRASNSEIRQRITEHRDLIDNRERIAALIKSMLDKLNAAHAS